MADNIVGGLFGFDQTQYDMQQRQQRQQEFARDFQAVQLSPLEQSKLAILQGTRAFGRGVGTLLGAQDPQLQKVSAIKQLSSQFDLTSPVGMRDFARSLQAQFPQEAMMAAKRAEDMAVSAATVTQKTRERMIPTSGLGKLLFEKDELLKAGVPATDPRVVAYDNAIKAEGEGKGTKVTVDARTQGESEFVKELGKNDAKVVTKAMETRGNAISTLQSLEKLEALNNQQLISGTFATGRVGAANFLNTIGLAGKDDVSRISSSQQYDKVAKDVIFQTLGGKLGAGFSNEDRKFIEALIPQLETSADARRKLITYMRGKQQLIADESTRLETYAREKRGLGGFEYKIPRETLAPSGSATKPEFTREQLQAEIERRNKGQ
jgi:hypothetical protein